MSWWWAAQSIDPASGSPVTRANGTTDFGSGMLPDGRYIMYARPRKVMAVYDHQTKRVTELTGLSGTAARWSTDGKYVYYFDYEGIPASNFREANVVRFPVDLRQGFRVTGPPEFVLYVQHPEQLRVGGNKIAVYSRGTVSTSKSVVKAARIGLWRNIGSELENTLPR